MGTGLCYDHFLAQEGMRWVQHRESVARLDRQALVDLARTDLEGEEDDWSYSDWLDSTGMST